MKDEKLDILEKIRWLGHASFKITHKNIIYIDPWKVKDRADADIILITHSHYDHFSETDIARIKKEDTVIVAPEDCAKKLKGEVKAARPGDTMLVKGINLEVVPAYNLNKPFHPREDRGVGYVIVVDGHRIYHAGDTDFIPEMENIRAEVALLPCGGTYTMNTEEAARAANRIGPKVAIPMHYGSIVGKIEDAQKFKGICKVNVKILNPQ